jgi:hypothetical protein
MGKIDYLDIAFAFTTPGSGDGIMLNSLLLLQPNAVKSGYSGLDSLRETNILKSSFESQCIVSRFFIVFVLL